MHLAEEHPLPLPRPTEVPTETHGVASGLFGHVPTSAEPLRTVAPDEAREFFLRGMLDQPTRFKYRNPLEWLVSVAVHTVVVTAVIVIPLMFTQVLDLHNLQVTYLSMPKPPAAAPAPAPPMIHAAPRPVQHFSLSKLTAPTLIPKQTFIAKDEQAPDLGEGVIGGIPGGEGGGVIGGILGGTGSGPAVPAPIARPATPKGSVLRIGGDIRPPRQIQRTEPEYPRVAQMAKVEGVVVIDAMIDEHGNVVQAHAVSGPGLLIASALAAVLQWKFEPTYLNGEPYPIQMNVQVVYHLR
jgi:protein TonB